MLLNKKKAKAWSFPEPNQIALAPKHHQTPTVSHDSTSLTRHCISFIAKFSIVCIIVWSLMTLTNRRIWQVESKLHTARCREAEDPISYK